MAKLAVYARYLRPPVTAEHPRSGSVGKLPRRSNRSHVVSVTAGDLSSGAQALDGQRVDHGFDALTAASDGLRAALDEEAERCNQFFADVVFRTLTPCQQVCRGACPMSSWAPRCRTLFNLGGLLPLRRLGAPAFVFRSSWK